MMFHLLIQTGLIILLMAPPGFSATYTVYSDLASYSQASATFETETFEGGMSFPSGVNVTSNMSNLTIGNDWSPQSQLIGKILFAYDTTQNDPRMQGNAYYQINFNPVYQYTAAAFEIKSWEIGIPDSAVDNGLVRLFFSDGTDYSVELSQTANMVPVFFGVVADTPLAYIQWYEPHEISGGNEETGLDNLMVGQTVPVPSTLLLLFSGLAGLAGISRKYRK